MKELIKSARLREAVKDLRADKERSAIAALYLSLSINIGYAVLQAINGIVQRSIWAGTLAFYYLILSVIRFSLLLGHKKVNILKKWKKYRRTAFVMLILNFALLGIHCITLYMGHTVEYPGYMIYAIALYTFYSAIAAVRNVVIYRKYRDPVLSASKAVALTTAAISIYTLQSAMISAFGNSEQFKVIMGNCVGAGVFLLICSISIFMIVMANKAVRNLRHGYQNAA